MCIRDRYKIGGIPVVDDEGHLVGIVTNRDLRFEKDHNKRIDEVMTKSNIVTTLSLIHISFTLKLKKTERKNG